MVSKKGGLFAPPFVSYTLLTYFFTIITAVTIGKYESIALSIKLIFWLRSQ